MAYSKWGLNQSAEVKSVSAVTTDKSTYLKVEVQIGEDRFPKTLRLVFPTTAYDVKAKKVVTSKELVQKEQATWKADVIEIFEVLSGIKNLESQVGRYATPAEFIGNLISLMPKEYLDQPVDVFLEYEKTPQPGKTRTYPVFPMSSRSGKFFCKGTTGTWDEVRVDGLEYVKGDRVHPFTRNAWFMSSAYAKSVQVVETAPSEPVDQAPVMTDADDLPF